MTELGAAALAGDQPPRPDHERHGRNGALLPRRPRRSARRHDRHSGVPPLLLRVRAEQTVAFFEYKDVELEQWAKPAGVPDRGPPSSTTCPSTSPDEDALESLRRRLKEYGCEVTDVVDHQVMHSIYFTDPNGIALEASWWVRRRHRPCTPTGATTASSPTPTRCRRSASSPATVSLAATPTTTLTHDPDDVADPA